MLLEDIGIILYKQKYSETSLIVTIFTQKYGIQKGLIKGGMNLKIKSHLEVGNIVTVLKRANNENNLGYFKIELIKSYLANILNNRQKTTALVSICALLNNFLAEKEPYPDLFHSTEVLITLLDKEDFVKYYLKWEVQLLNYIGLGLDLNKCAVTSSTEDLYYISPRTGRAVSKSVGEPYKDKLFIIPDLLKTANLSEYIISNDDGKNIFKITSHFFRHFSLEYHIQLPFSRQVLIKQFDKNNIK